MAVRRARWSRKSWPIAARQTIGAAVAERTAAVIWGMLDQIQVPVFLWNVFPLHPHEPGNPFTNRQHNARERQAGEEMLCLLLELLRPQRVVAIGNDAHQVATRISQSCQVTLVRHPSYGGQRQFEEQIAQLYDLQGRNHAFAF